MAETKKNVMGGVKDERQELLRGVGQDRVGICAVISQGGKSGRRDISNSSLRPFWEYAPCLLIQSLTRPYYRVYAEMAGWV